MYVVRVSAAGTPVGLPGLVGPADISSQPLWSPLGRYLVWQWNDRKSHSENQGVVELYDTTTDKLVALRNLTVGAVAAAGTGAQVVLQRNESAVANVFYDRLGHGRTSGQATFKQLVSVLAVGHREALVETGDISGNSGKPATLWLLPPSGPPVRMSTIPTVRFLSMDIPPALGWTASANDGVHAAFVTALGQDGSCANGQSVHLVDLDARTDLAVALPYKDGDLRTPSYSPDGVLGGVLDECGTEGPDYHNSFVELHGSHWTTVVAGATLGARGPDGLLAVQLGSFPKKDYGANPSQDHPLTIRTASGATTARLPTATAIAWTQAATPPKG
jgi:anti-sigma-K factor RskA